MGPSIRDTDPGADPGGGTDPGAGTDPAAAGSPFEGASVTVVGSPDRVPVEIVHGSGATVRVNAMADAELLTAVFAALDRASSC